MKTGTVIQLAGFGIVGYLLWKLMNKGEEYKEEIADKIAKLWLKMFPLPPQIQLQGAVLFPGNIKVPIQTLHDQGAVKHTPEPDFAVYVNYAGSLWKLAPQVYGNWPATRVQ